MFDPTTPLLGRRLCFINFVAARLDLARCRPRAYSLKLRVIACQFRPANKFYESKAFVADSTLFDVLTYEFIEGNPRKALADAGVKLAEIDAIAVTQGPGLAGALLVGASIVFGQLQAALNRVFRSDAARLGGMLAWLRKRLLSFGMAIAVGFLLVVSMAVQAALAVVMAWLPDLLPVFAEAFSLVLYALVFAGMYRLLPDRPVSPSRALAGGALTAGLFIVGRWAIGLYLGQASLGNAYGPAGGLVVMLVWLYYCAVVFLAGALITAMLDEHARVARRLARQRARADRTPPAATDATTGRP